MPHQASLKGYCDGERSSSEDSGTREGGGKARSSGNKPLDDTPINASVERALFKKEFSSEVNKCNGGAFMMTNTT